jgi:hypothetical protein
MPLFSTKMMPLTPPPVRDRRSAASRLRPLRRQQRFDQYPQFIAYERLAHAGQNSLLLPPFPVL